MIKRVLIFVCLAIILGCDYQREQAFPSSVDVIINSEYCNFNIYRVKQFSLKNLNKTTLSDWQKGLICEGYTDRIHTIAWQEYNTLLYTDRVDLKYFINKTEDCFDVKFSLEELTISACISKLKNSHHGNFDTNYHKIFLLDKGNSKFYEIENLN